MTVEIRTPTRLASLDSGWFQWRFQPPAWQPKSVALPTGASFARANRLPNSETRSTVGN
jgi:hypothetical protein